MTKEQIDKAFEGRWRIKGHQLTEGAKNIDALFSNDKGAQLVGYVKTLCRDFFTAGIMIGDKDCITNPPDTIVVVDFDKLVPPPNKTLFEWWWDMYDKKVDRGKCEKKWEKLTDSERRACIAATPAYVASTSDIQFRRNPMTYLNNKSWENQIIPRNNGTNNTTIEERRRDKLASILTE